MKVLRCGHAEQPAASKLCAHLIGQAEVGFFRALRGEKLKYDLCCRECATTLKSGEGIELFEVCSACVALIDEEQWELLGWVGEPSVEEMPELLDYSIETILYPPELANAKAIHPLGMGRVLGFDGHQLGIYTPEGFSPLLDAELAEVENEEGYKIPVPRFHLSKSGRFAALVHDYGQFGQVFDLEEANVTMKLNRGDYHPDTQPFPCAFFECKGREFIVHGSDWNRLEISDPLTGELLTARDPLVYSPQGERPTHYLDYFHGRLHVSPNSQWVADDGWIWHPVGDITAWNLEAWLDANVYESEDGESRKSLCYRNHLWDVPVCWIDNSRIAIWGIGLDDEAMLDGARIFDAESGEEINQFAGPTKGQFWSDGKRLFSNESDGLHVWNVESGARVAKIEGFRIDFQTGDKFIEIKENCLRVLTLN